MTQRTYESMIAELLQHDQTQIDAYFSVQHKEIRKSITLMQSKLTYDRILPYTTASGWILEKPGFLPDAQTYLVSRDSITEGLGKHRLHTAGCVYMQEVAASIPAGILDIPAGGLVLDMCAAPGGKSVQIADALLRTKQPGLVISNEINPARTITLQSNLNRMGAYNTVVTNISGEKRGGLITNQCDAVLIDAPCSGEGTGFKSDAGTKRRRKETIDEIVHLQKSLIISGIHACKPGGHIVYATCTINPRENESVVAHALAICGDSIELIPTGINHGSAGITTRDGTHFLTESQASYVTRFRPHIQHTGGFFIAAFRKKAASSPLDATKGSRNALGGSQLDISPALQQQVAQRLMIDFGIIIDPKHHFFLATPKQVYLTSNRYQGLHGQFPIQKAGIPLYKKDEKGLRRPLHGIGQALGHLATHHTISLTASDIAAYASGRDIDWTMGDKKPDAFAPGFYVILFDGIGASMGKYIPGTLKNKFLKS